MFDDFAAEVEKVAMSVLDDVHTAIPAKILSFDPKKSLAEVQPIGSYTLVDDEEEDDVTTYPIVTDVPVMFPYCESANAGIAFPIKEGDSVLLIVSEVELDEFFSGAESDGCIRFDLTSAIAIPGLFRSPGKIVQEACSGDSVVIRNGTTKLAVNRKGVALTGNLTVEGDISYTGNLKHV